VDNELNSKIYMLLTDLSVKVADISARLSGLSSVFVEKSVCEQYRDKCLLKNSDIENRKRDRIFKVALEVFKLALVAIAGWAAGTKIM